MSVAKKTSNDKEKPAPEKKEANTPATITAVTGLITGIIGAIGGLLVILHQIGAFPFSPTPTPTPSFTFTLSPTWTASPFPTDTPAPSATLTQTETLTLTPPATETSTPAATSGIACPWLPYSTLNPSITIGQNCLNDLLNLGISETDSILFYREKGMSIGVFGISKKTAIANELNVEISIKELTAVRFLALVSQQKQGYQSSIGFRILREGNKKLIQLVRYDSNGFDSVISETKELDMWNGNLRLTLVFTGPRVRAYVNDTYFGQTQIEFSDRHLFLGYQVMSGGSNRPYLHVIIKAP